MMDYSGDIKQSLSATLNSWFSTPLLAASKPASTSSEPPSRNSVDRDSMRSVRTRPPSPRIVSGASGSRNHSKALSMSLPEASSSSQSLNKAHKREQSQPTLPVLRWFTGKQSSKAPDTSQAPHTRPGTPVYSDSPTITTPASHFSALADALDDDPRLLEAQTPHVDMPHRPEAARLHPPVSPWRPPNHLSDLSRSTLPTAGLSHTCTIYKTPYTDPFDDPYAESSHPPELDIFFSPTPTPVAIPHTPAPAHLNRSPPSLSASSTRSSIDTLRSIHERGSRGIHTTPSQQKLTLPSFTNPIRGWFNTEESQKENMDPFLNEADKANTPQAQKETIRQNYVSPQNPVVFCHGLLGFDIVTLGPAIAPLQVTHWRGIKDALETNGTEVLITRVPATSSPIERAKVLEEKISAAYPGRSVHLIGHSMGGLDCRYLTTHLTHRKFKVLSITTISTPHRGSPFANRFLDTVGAERMPSVLSLLDLLPNGGGNGKAFEFLTTENMKKFNEETPDVEGVKYFSWGAVYEPGLIDTWKWPHAVILEKEGPNDGLVSLNSARWGTYLGTLEGVNHLDLVGWINTARYKWAEIMGREIKFKPATFYLGIADHLARVVEGQEQGQAANPEQAAREQVFGSLTKSQETLEEGVSAEEQKERKEIREESERAEMADSLGKGTTPTPASSSTDPGPSRAHTLNHGRESAH